MSTIIGTNKNKMEHSSFLLQVRYSTPDAKVTLQKYIAENPLLRKTPLTKKLVKEIFFKNLLCHLPRKGVEPLAEFLFNKALQNEYIVLVPKIWVDDPDEYIVSPTIDEKRPGPKTKNKNE